MYMLVKIQGMQVTALFETGNSINIISMSLFDKLPIKSKSNFRSCNEQTVKLANNQSVCVFGTASISVQTLCSSTVCQGMILCIVRLLLCFSINVVFINFDNSPPSSHSMNESIVSYMFRIEIKAIAFPVLRILLKFTSTILSLILRLIFVFFHWLSL